MAGLITQEDKDFVEQWENISQITNDIVKLDNRGDEKHELISGPRTFMVTTEERMITQGKILDPKHDPFLNGCFRPVVVPDNVNIETNPNALSDEEMAKILSASDLAFEEWLTTLTSPETLSRMVELASDMDDISLKRFKMLGARLAEVSPKKRIVQKDRDQFEAMASADRPRSTTGRSADYR